MSGNEIVYSKLHWQCPGLGKDQPGTYGFILNRVFAAAYREAKKIVDDGLATEEDVDKAMITGRNWPAAFFGNRGGIGKQW